MSTVAGFHLKILLIVDNVKFVYSKLFLQNETAS